ncbi:reprolysin-like metallopeptidase [Emticicia sp. SJ17W-69]|uniref:reprolysin-like metallopeptidase n=1 Tax=Emticicia sp. SJ17W-69 TaxID=3421657 RepID=UPI003EBF5F99
MKKYLLFILFSQVSFVFAQNNIRKVSINIGSYRNQLANVPFENTIVLGKTLSAANVISLPFPNGQSFDFQIVEYSILPKGTNSDIKTYHGLKVGDESISCRISLTKDWLVATIYTNEGIVVIERSKQALDLNEYDVYLQSQNEFECKAENSINANGRLRDIDGILNYTNGASLRTYRMALFVTDEFYIERGNTNATINNEVTAIVNSLNGVYEREIAVRFTLVSPNNPVSANVFYRKTEAIGTYNQDINTIRVEMNTRFGAANYDLGQCLHNTGGGVAYYGVCNNSYKGGGWSGSTSPSSVLLMAHEVGHQFTAPHTFLGNGNSNCSDGNRSLSTAFEPGSGNTIMSYASLCIAAQNISGGKVPYFHTNSLQSMITYIQAGGTGNTCGTATATGNTPPVAVAGTAFTIPKNTPFTLIGSGTDANGDVLNYTWEEYDLPVANDVGALGSGTNGVGGYAAINSTTAPLFRSRQSSSPQREFPALSSILNNANNPPDTEGEDLPNVSRTMNFRLTVRDNRAGGGGTHCSAVVVTVDATKGPLAVTLPNGGETWTAGNSHTITWSVNNTNSLSANVDIYLSVDGGNTFPYLIVSNTPNDGTESYLVSANIANTTQARVKVVSRGSATANFFDISNANFTLTSTCQAISSIICSDATLTAQAGNAALNLGLNFTPVSKFIGSSRSFSTAGAGSRMIVGYSDNTFTTCQNIFSDNSILLSFRVSKTGQYTISGLGDNSAGSEPFSVFTSNTMNCSTFVGSNSYATPTGIGWFGSRSINLNACTTYYIAISTFFDPINITLNIQGLGNVYEIASNPVGYSYTYLALNTSTNTVSAVSSTSNFTSLSAGTFEVYGVMYKNGITTATFVGQSLNAIISANCLIYSDNKKILNITPNPCSTLLTLINPTDNISTGNITKQASATNGTITATNFVTGAGTRATYQAKKIQLNAGFKADNGTVFKAEIGGCN